jgi:hypothetical protein
LDGVANGGWAVVALGTVANAHHMNGLNGVAVEAGRTVSGEFKVAAAFPQATLWKRRQLARQIYPRGDRQKHARRWRYVRHLT